MGNLTFELLRSLLLAELLPLDFVCSTEEVDDSPNSLQGISSLRTNSRISSNFNLLLPNEILIVVTVAFQFSGKEARSIKARTSSFKLIPAKLN